MEGLGFYRTTAEPNSFIIQYNITFFILFIFCAFELKNFVWVPCYELQGLEHGEFVRVRTVHLNGKPRVLTLKQDLHYWPTWELKFDPDAATWRRRTIKALECNMAWRLNDWSPWEVSFLWDRLLSWTKPWGPIWLKGCFSPPQFLH